MVLPISDDQMLLLAELSAPVQWAVLGVAVLGTAIVLFKPKFLKRDPLSRSPQSTSLSQQRSVERQMQSLLVELSEMSRQVTSTLDTRAAKLDLLIREADEKIATLTALQANGSPGAISSFQMDASQERSMVVATLNASSGSSPVEREIAPELSAFADSARAGSPSFAPSPYDADARHAEVYLLADQGQSSSEIASQLRRPNGEIQLILALRPDTKAR